MTMSSKRRLVASFAVAALAVIPAACGSDGGGADAAADTATGGSEDALTIYSGRNEGLVGPILEDLEEAVGTQVEVRYAGSSELAAQLLEEGEATDADLFFSQDAGALGALAKADRLATLPDDVLSVVPQQYQDAQGRWVATSARARVLAFDPRQAPEVEQLTSIDAILDEKYRGLIGYAPTNASFHSFVTALRVVKGEDRAREWLERFAELEPQAYEGNTAVLDAVDSGEVAIGLINHYYWYQRVAEVGQDAVNARIRFLGSDDPGALVNVAGVGVLAGSEQQDAAVAAVEFLLGEHAQHYFAEETAEYPVIAGVDPGHDLAPLGELTGSSVDPGDLDDLEGTLALLDEVGLT